jgi:hypothetical protein
MRKYLFLLMFSLLTSCEKDKKIRSEKGGIDLLTNIYYDASKGLDNHQQIILSKLNYQSDDIVELVPNIQMPELIDSVYYIRDSIYYNAGNLMDAKSFVFNEKVLDMPRKLSDKKFGAIWINTQIFGYENRKDLNDTILYGKKEFKRFQIVTKDNYSIFYIAKTDTILPYSLNPSADKDYSGRLERIDSYDKKRDLFTTINLLPRKNWDREAAEIFEYNYKISDSEKTR